jgi:hypothetical protein
MKDTIILFEPYFRIQDLLAIIMRFKLQYAIQYEKKKMLINLVNIFRSNLCSVYLYCLFFRISS